MTTNSHEIFQRGAGKAIFAMGMLIISIEANITALLYENFLGIKTPEASTVGIYANILIIQAAIYALTGVAFLLWFYRMHKNLFALRVDGLRFSSDWAVGCFFIPILNLFRPYQVAAEIVKGSNSTHSSVGNESWKTSPIPVIVIVWWGLFLLSSLLSVVAGFIVVEGFGGDTFRYFLSVSAIENMARIIGAIFAIILILRVMRAQAVRYVSITTGDRCDEQNGFAVASFIMGLFAIPTMIIPVLNLGIFPILAIITGHIAKRRNRKTKQSFENMLANVGLITGYTGALITAYGIYYLFHHLG